MWGIGWCSFSFCICRKNVLTLFVEKTSLSPFSCLYWNSVDMYVGVYLWILCSVPLVYLYINTTVFFFFCSFVMSWTHTSYPTLPFFCKIICLFKSLCLSIEILESACQFLPKKCIVGLALHWINDKFGKNSYLNDTESPSPWIWYIFWFI